LVELAVNMARLPAVGQGKLLRVALLFFRGNLRRHHSDCFFQGVGLRHVEVHVFTVISGRVYQPADPVSGPIGDMPEGPAGGLQRIPDGLPQIYHRITSKRTFPIS
jgi:hypothetical protein